MRLFLATTFSGLLSLVGCSFLSCAHAPSYERPPIGGFVRDVDEPSTRGQLYRISLPDVDVQWNYSLSPDGRSVVFSGRQAGSSEPYQLYRLDIGGQTPVKITSGGRANVWNPSYTRDGEWIVYESQGAFWKVKKDGSGARTKIPGSGLNIDYCPEVSLQDRVVFVTYDSAASKSLIWAVGLDGSELTQYREGNHPTWSPDGSKIAFQHQGDIWVMNLDGTSLTQITCTETVHEDLPAFSPDGGRIAFVSDEGSKGKTYDANIWYIGVDGTGKTQVTDLASWDSWPKWATNGIYFLSGRARANKDIVRIWRIDLTE